MKKAEQSKSDLSNAEAAYSSLREENHVLEKSIQEMRIVLESQRESLANVRLELAEKRQLLLSVDETIERAELEKRCVALMYAESTRRCQTYWFKIRAIADVRAIDLQV